MGFLSAIGGIVGNLVAPGIGGAIGGALGGLGDSAISGGSASDAASTQAQGANAGVALQKQIYEQNRQDQMPFYNTGVAANQQLAYLMGLNPSTSGTASGAPTGYTKMTGQEYATITNGKGGAVAPGSYSVANPGSPTGDTIYVPTQYVPQGFQSTVDKLAPGATPDLPPGSSAANGAFGSLSKPFSAADFVADPGYQFSVSEGEKALERSAAAKGGLMSGAALKAITEFGQGTAAQEYQQVYDRYNTNQTNLYNRLAGLSGTGQVAANNNAATGTNYANNAATGIQNAANYNASGQVANTNAWTTGLNSAVSGLSNYFGGNNGSTTTGNSSVNYGLGGLY